MEYSELLYDFVDGTTDAAQEQTLFAALASHDDLRADFKQLMAMKTAVQHDTKAFNPPAESTLALFSTLGFAAPVIETPVAAQSTVPSNSAGFFAGASKTLLTGLAMSAITAVSMFFIMNNRAEMTKSEVAQKANIAQTVNGVVSDSKNLNQQLETIRTITLPAKEIIKYVYVNAPEDQLNTQEGTSASEQISQDISVTDYQSPALVLNSTSKNSNWKHVDYDASLMPIPLDAPSGGNNSRFTFEVRRIDTRPTNQPTFVSSTPILNNLAFTALYSLNPEFSAGIEISQEQSFQLFEHTNTITGEKAVIEQHPSLLSAAGVVRYAPFEWGKFQPLVQASVGGSELGLFSRGLLGVQYTPEPFLSFMIAAEGNMQRFRYQNEVYSTTKYGLSYGMSFHF